MQLVVCGCSWSTECPFYPDTGYGYHLSQILEADEYINLARPSASNLLIRTQIDYAIQNLNPDLLVVCWTTPERLTWKYDKSLTLHHEHALGQTSYWDNQRYGNKLHPAPLGDGDSYCITAESWSSLFAHYEEAEGDIVYQKGDVQIDRKQFEYLSNYFMHFIDSDMLRTEQYYLVESAVHALQSANVPFLMSPSWNNQGGTFSTWDVIPDKNKIDVHPSNLERIELTKHLDPQPTHHLHSKQHQVFARKSIAPKASALLNETK